MTSKIITIQRKSQTWSVDIALAIVVFLGAFFIFYYFLGSNPSTQANILKQEAAVVITQATSENGAINILDNNSVSIAKVSELKKVSYDELKSRLRIDGDFCLYLEDEKGNIVLIGNTYKGLGSEKIMLGRTPCSQ